MLVILNVALLNCFVPIRLQMVWKYTMLNANYNMHGCEAWTGVLKRNNYLYLRWQHLENYLVSVS